MMRPEAGSPARGKHTGAVAAVAAVRVGEGDRAGVRGLMERRSAVTGVERKEARKVDA